MQSKISLVNKEIRRTIIRSVGWVTIVHFLGLIIALPLEILMTATGEQRQYIRAESLFYFHFEIQAVLNIGIPVILAVFLFRYLQVKPYSDFIHSLPIKRDRLFHQYALTGMILLIFPVLLIAIIISALYIPLNLAEFFTWTDIFKWLGITIMFNLLVFLAGVFTGMISGISAVQGILTYIFLLLPMGLLVLLAYNLPFYLYGFADQYVMESKVESFSPLVALSQIDYRPLGAIEIIVYCLLIFILYGVSLWVYKNRRLEAVTQSLVFPLLKPIFKYGMTFCTMLLGGLYFGIMEGNTTWLIAGYVFGAILGYFVAEMVLQKSWRIIIHIKGLIIYAGAMALLVILFQFDFTQFEKKVPNLSEVERIHLSENYFMYSDAEDPFYLTTIENMDLIRRLHKEIIANKNENKLNDRSEHAFFVYELKNGKKLVRDYVINKKEYAHYYKLIHESEEYKRVTNGIFKLKEDQIEKITIHPYGPIQKKAVIVDPADIKEAIAVLKDEINTATYEETEDDRDPLAFIEIMQKNEKTVGIEWRISYKNFEEWLDKKELLEQAKVTAADISYAYIVDTNDLKINYAQGYSYEELFEQMRKIGHSIKVTDKKRLEESLINASGIHDGPYMIGYYYKADGSIDIKSFTAEHIPEFVQKYFK
ncbi:DUF6449 domain-containing protein [Cytobacillus massiliigabonensis]|uniref:DUF6449 domain-containing protein n=1 Tax=Cytobacillus massiliigabonensis TaxID=1871011 RepID=UPI001F15F1DB|nr:DUF6449 domain-containing protein [Cytobacillus massiliigabonensis]